ncbi:uncharacterized protein LOC108908198 [Anoplophora glabripennis]|uniref:uncharacterized protein LOC108908198 n=1 Tax=Anoplophora glabripennis TaxID=217634 RepID=UPI000874085C|nr:uncharacterized protein LOC108908198 [Anoplophora glabripennis]
MVVSVVTEINEGTEDSYKMLDDAASLHDVNALQSPENRKKTDGAFLFVFVACIVLLLPFVIYTLCYSDINRLKGYDNCGNICGQENVIDYRWRCTGQDMSLKPILYGGECIEAKDVGAIDGKTLFELFRRVAWKIMLVSFVPLALCSMLVALFHYTPRVAVWSILILSWLVFTMASIALMIPLSVFGLILSFIVMIKLWVLFFKRSKIRLVAVLIKEATKPVFEVKMLFHISIGALAVLIVILLIYTTITFRTITAGKPVEMGFHFMEYEKIAHLIYIYDGLMLTTIILSAIATFWGIQFVFGAQDVIVSRTIARWYTTKNQDNLDDAVSSSLQVTLNYHLGTIALGSAVKTVMFVPRLIIGFFALATGLNDCFIRCVGVFLTNRIYIATATHGTSFIQSGKKMVRVLKMSNGNTADVVSFGNFVIVLGQILVISISTSAGFLVVYNTIGFYTAYTLYFTLVELGIAVMCAQTILGTLKVSTNTLFFCASEELLRNKEADLPYSMSMSEFFDGTIKLFLQKVQNKPMSNAPGENFYIKMSLVVFVSISCAFFFVAYFAYFIFRSVKVFLSVTTRKSAQPTMKLLTEIHKTKQDSYQIIDDANSLSDPDVLRRPQTRRKTDTFFLIVFAACIIIFLPFLIYTLCYSDINRLNGYDKCGNICGQKNVGNDQWSCTGQDMTFKPRLNYLQECEEGDRYHFPEFGGEWRFNFFHRTIWVFLLASFVPLFICLILVTLFRYAPAVAVWGILILSWLILTSTGFLFLYISHFLWEPILIIIVSIISALLLCFGVLFRLNNIRLATVLLKEAARPVFEVKMVAYVSVGALSALIFVLVTYITVTLNIATAGRLTEVEPDYLIYVDDDLMSTTKILNSVAAFWTVLFLLGAQYMSVSGAIAQWYTTKTQENIRESASSSFLATIKYHLGTIALGSVMMTIMYIPRVVLQFLTIFSALKEKADSWLRWLDGFFTNNSYIITATHGTSFMRSGKQAAKLLELSIGNTRDLNSFGNFVIMICQGFVIGASTLSAFALLSNTMVPYNSYIDHFVFIEFGIASICAYTILGTLRVSTNTLFLCASEELLRSNEADLPYNMSMKRFLDGSNKLFLEKVQSRIPSNWTKKRFCITLTIFVSITCVLLFGACII